MSQYKVDFNAAEWISPLHGVRFRAHKSNGKQLRVVEYAQDFVEPDWCLKGHVGYVMEGSFEIEFNGTIVEYGPGDGIFIPPGEEHKHKAHPLSDLVRVVLVEDIA